MRLRSVALLLALAAALGATAPAQTPASFSTAPRLTGYLQPRFQALGDTASFFLRRARFAVEGSITPWASYRAQVEMRTSGTAPTPATSPLTLSATDLWIKLTHGAWGGTVGQFRVPFSLESLLGSTILETTERSRIVNAAKRDIGVQAEWRLPDRVVLQGAAVNAQGIYRAVRWTARAEYIDEHNRRTGTHTKGWYALAGYDVLPQRVELVGRVEQFDPSDRVASDRSTGYLLGLQYFVRGDAFKMMADYELFREQAIQVKNDRAVVQMQVRW